MPYWFHHGEGEVSSSVSSHCAKAGVGCYCPCSGDLWAVSEWTGHQHRQYVYISNRAEWIRKSTRPEQWHHAQTRQNPADVATRSVPVVQLTDTTWLTSPDFLAHSVETDTAEETSYSLIDPESDIEVQCHTTTTTNSNRGIGAHHFERFAKWQSLVRAMASLFHIVQCFKSEKDSNKQDCNGWHHCSKPHATVTLSQAKAIIIRCVQKDAYQAELSCLEKGKTFLKTIPWGSSTLLSMTMDSWGQIVSFSMLHLIWMKNTVAITTWKWILIWKY